MQDRRRYRRVNYFASSEFAEMSVLKSWLAVIRKNELNGIVFTLVKEDSENVHICEERN